MLSCFSVCLFILQHWSAQPITLIMRGQYTKNCQQLRNNLLAISDYLVSWILFEIGVDGNLRVRNRIDFLIRIVGGLVIPP